jgi:hypothetical protein
LRGSRRQTDSRSSSGIRAAVHIFTLSTISKKDLNQR